MRPPWPAGPECRLDEAPFSDEELEALAIAAEPNPPLAPDAVPVEQFLGLQPAPLPEWYMAPVTLRRAGRWHRVGILAFVAALLLIEAAGLCSTYGQLPFH